MKNGVFRHGTTSAEHERPKDGPYRGVGALFLLAGSVLVFSESRKDSASVGDGLGFLLVLLGSGLMLGPRQEEAHPAP